MRGSRARVRGAVTGGRDADDVTGGRDADAEEARRGVDEARVAAVTSPQRAAPVARLPFIARPASPGRSLTAPRPVLLAGLSASPDRSLTAGPSAPPGRSLSAPGPAPERGPFFTRECRTV